MNIKNKLVLTIISGLGSGYSKYMPGTAGSIACICVWVLLKYYNLLNHPFCEIGFIAVCTIVGIICINSYLNTANIKQDNKKIDPQFIVIDEWAGMLIALFGTGSNEYKNIGIAFILFRLFDMTKPFFIKKLENLKGAYGIMLDDIAAGILALIILNLYKTFY